MKAVWKDETTHAESVYCMCSIPHTAIECYRHPTQPIVVFVLFGVYCAWSLLAFIHIFFAIGYAVQRTLVQTTAFVSILHSLLLWVRCCCCCQFVHIFRLGLFIFFAHACSQHCATILYLISMCMGFFPLSLSHLSHLTTFVNVNFICEPMYWNIPKKSQATWFSEGTRNTNYSFRCVVQSWCACVVVLKHNHSLLLCLSMYVLWLLLCVHFCDAHREKCCFSEWFSGLIYCILSQKLFHF